MYLHSQRAIEFAVLRVVVDDHAHYVAVENVRHRVAADDQMERVPIVVFNKRDQRIFIANGADDLRFAVGIYPTDIPSLGQEGAALLFVVLAGVFVCTIDISLIAAAWQTTCWEFLRCGS